MKPIRGITWQSYRWPGTDPTPWTNQAARYKAKSNQLSFNHSKWASICNQTWWKTFNHPTSFIITMVPLITLCGRSIKQSQLLWETNDSNWISQPCKANLTHTPRAPKGHPSNFSPFFLGCGSGSPSPTTEPCSILTCVYASELRSSRVKVKSTCPIKYSTCG
jgi:hypothetical protein